VVTFGCFQSQGGNVCQGLTPYHALRIQIDDPRSMRVGPSHNQKEKGFPHNVIFWKEQVNNKPKRSFQQRAARASWILFLASIGLIAVDFAIFEIGPSVFVMITMAGAFVLLLLAGVIFGIIGCLGVRRYGARTTLVPGIIGVVLNFAILGWLTSIAFPSLFEPSSTSQSRTQQAEKEIPDSDGEHFPLADLNQQQKEDILVGVWGDTFPMPAGLDGYAFLKNGRFIHFGLSTINIQKRYQGSVGNWKIQNDSVLIQIESNFYWDKDYIEGPSGMDADPSAKLIKKKTNSDEWLTLGNLSTAVNGFARMGVVFPLKMRLRRIDDGKLAEEPREYYRFDDGNDLAKEQVTIIGDVNEDQFLQLLRKMSYM